MRDDRGIWKDPRKVGLMIVTIVLSSEKNCFTVLDPFAPNTDATHLGVDAVLSQVKDGKSESWSATVNLLFDRSVTTALPDKSFL